MGHICSKQTSEKKVVPTDEDKTLQSNSETKPMPKIVFVLGGPGSGKGTVCAKIVEEFKYLHLSAGDLLRDEVKMRPDSELSLAIQENMKEGTLVPPTVIVPLLRNKINDSPAVPGFLIDGFPREVGQANLFEEQISKPTHVIFVECNEETMKQRLMKRGETSGRIDDNEETIHKRFETYQQHSLPVVEYYKKLNLVTVVDGTASPQEAYAQAQKSIAGL